MFNISDRFCIQLRDVLADAVVVPFTSVLVNTCSKFQLFAVILPGSWQMCTFPLIYFRELSASTISTFSSRSCRPSGVWPETTSSAAAWLATQTAGRPWWTPLSVRLERSCYWTFSCFFLFHFRLSFQSNCRASEYKEVLYALLGFIISLSAVASPEIQVR